MTTPAPASRRRRFAIDARLVIGLALVAASVAGVLAVIASADRRVVVYAAAQTLAPGERIDADQLVVRQVALDDAAGLYLAEGALPDGGLVMNAVVRRGELVPLAALGTSADARSTSIVLALAGDVSEAVVAGALVDVWASPARDGDGTVGSAAGFGPPVVLNADALVVRVVEHDGFASVSDGRSVEVRVPRSRIARLLQAIANGDALAVVPAGIPLSGT